ncbi:MAG: RNA pseudouridine synthase [Erythrobacter sp.]
MMIDILYEDGEALLINKPAGLPVDRPRRGGPCLEDHYEQLKLGFHRPPSPVHRLDTDTSGCLLLARNPKALKRFNKAFEERTVGKVYIGILAGIPHEESGQIDMPLSKISSAEKGWRMIPAQDGKQASTAWAMRQQHDGRALIEFKPETGRTHQIRVHAASGIGIPLFGDPVYGAGAKQAPRTMLHAAELLIPRPGKTDIAASAPTPEDFVQLGFE